MAVRAFTSKHKGLANCLFTPVIIADPIKTRYKGLPADLTRQYNAIWDTGATNSVITKKVADDLGLSTLDLVTVCGVDGPMTSNKYLVDFYLPNHLQVIDVQVTEGKLTGFDVLIGMDIICLGDFAVSNFEGNTSFTFRTPSAKETDYVVESKVPAKSTKLIGRNQLCPCGSNKKFKYCTCKEFHS